MNTTITVIIEHDLDSGYYAYCPDFEGCQTQGDTLGDVIQNIREAAELYLETLTDEEKEQLYQKRIYTTTLAL
ncbi:MAG: type II toxin-antitoxin system HicB family antitoxin [Sphingobacteriales bacterium]|nr:MAG: type II toxin-antitoxin system HicB family antitoxin [Sphingobacteriales bacterium]